MSKTEPRATILIAGAEGTAAWIAPLAEAGYAVKMANDADTVLGDFARTAPDVVLIDGGLAQGAGFTICGALRAVTNIPILMLIADDEAEIEQAYALGATDVLLQPVRRSVLLHTIESFIQIYRQSHKQRVLAEALRDTAALLTSTLEQHEVLDLILEQVNTVVPCESTNIMLIEAGIASVVRSRGYGQSPNRMALDGMRVVVDETESFRWMMEHNRALLIANTDEYAGWQKFPETDPWLKSYVSAPIRIGNHIIGFLNIDSSQPNHFNEGDAERLQIFADQAAIAIRNARLYDRVRRQATELERRMQERTADLEYERSQLRAIIDAMTEGVAYTEYVDGEYHTLYVNEAMTRITGFSADEWRDESLHLLRAAGTSEEAFQQSAREVEAALRAKGYYEQEIGLRRKDGSPFDAAMIISRVSSSSESVVGLLMVLRDVSQENALQQQKERFVAYASHELRTPITNLKTRLYLMQRQPERMSEHVQVLEYVTDRMKRLVEDLLDFSRFERGVIRLEFREIVLQQLIHSLVLVQLPEAERKQLALTVALPDTPIHVRADSDRLAQVITNLLSNAINYTPSGGRIVVRLTQHDERAVVEVEDTGIGISTDHLPHIFQPFYRVVSPIEGSGLGLSITREIVELHGSAIEVSSQPGVGSNFRFSLPVVGAPVS